MPASARGTPAGPLSRVGSALQTLISQSRDNGRVRLLVVEDEKRLAAALKRGPENEGLAVDLTFDRTEGEWLCPRKTTMTSRTSALRRKIDKPFGTHPIETLHGSGYRLVGQSGETIQPLG